MNQASQSIDIKTLQFILDYGSLSADTAGELLAMQRIEKERMVLKTHKYIINGPYKSGNRTLYKTRAPWLPSKSLNRNDRNALIDALYEHYFSDTVQDFTVQEMYAHMIKYYEDR